MNLRLQGKRALVTGSTAGIGFSVASALAGEGVSVIINGRTQDRVDRTIKTIREINPGSGVTGFAGDLSTSEGARILTSNAENVDILINNLGIYEPKAFTDTTDEDWLRAIEVNLISGVRLSRHYLPKMLKRNWGRIIFISSESGVDVPSDMIHYGVTKTAQISLARGLAELTAGTHVTVNSVLPGPTNSEGVHKIVVEQARARGVEPSAIEKEYFQTSRPTSLLRRLIGPEEIANTVLYLCSPLASATNGAAIRADGGVLRSIL
ncbi:MAG: SDR family NAD(P)-dependent oxidoreductase [Blastocatellia bacterium]